MSRSSRAGVDGHRSQQGVNEMLHLLLGVPTLAGLVWSAGCVGSGRRIPTVPADFCASRCCRITPNINTLVLFCLYFQKGAFPASVRQ